jgi:hypothetical protein
MASLVFFIIISERGGTFFCAKHGKYSSGFTYIPATHIHIKNIYNLLLILANYIKQNMLSVQESMKSQCSLL